MDDYRNLIIRAYGGMAARDFTFVSEARQEERYASLLVRLRRQVKVTDVTNWEEDVAYRLGIDTSRPGWVLWLSLVGPFAVIHEGWSRNSTPRPSSIYPPHRPVDVDVSSIIDTVESFSLRFLAVHELLRPIDFVSVQGETPVPLYRALFTDEEAAFDFLGQESSGGSS
ncbi:MAG TPA: hypothetical protein VI248_17880 [Kineosporiaceae bacterium]